MGYNIHCEKCGHEFEVEKWNPGMQCPKCQASDTVPITKMVGPEPKPGQRPPSVDDKKEVATPGWKNSPVVAGIAIVVIVATWLILGIWKFKKPATMKVEVWAQCAECSERVKKITAEIGSGAACAKCGKKKTVHTLYECRGEEGKECDNTFVFTPPPSPTDPYREDSKGWENMSEEKRNEAMMKADEAMIEHDKAQMEASKCPKCGSHNTGPVYTEEQKEKFEKMRKKYAKEKR